MNWVDFVILAIILLGILTGIKKGFLMSISNIVSMLVSILVAKNYYKMLTVFLIDKTIIEEKIMNVLLEKNFIESFAKNMPKEAMMVFATEEFMQNIHYFATMLILNALSIITIYFAVRIVLLIAEGFMKNATELPGLREINRLGGGAVGLGKSIIILLILFAFVIPISNVESWGFIRDGLDESTLSKHFFKYNFVLKWIWSSATELFRGI